MSLLWGAVIQIVTLFWLGQVVAAISPRRAERWGLIEPASEADNAFLADARGEAIWDALVLWTLPAAGVLLLLQHPGWPYFGLVGGGMWLYAAGRAIIVRLLMQRRGVRAGTSRYTKVAMASAAVWGLIALAAIVVAAAALSLPARTV